MTFPERWTKTTRLDDSHEHTTDRTIFYNRQDEVTVPRDHMTRLLYEAGYLLEICEYKDVWTDEVGDIPVCVLHDQNSRHVDSDDPHRPCLEVDPYPEEKT